MSIFVCLIKAWIIAFATSAPIGPIGMLCIRKTIELGFAGTKGVGLGAAIADTIYGSVAALGISAISSFIIDEMIWIKMAGGVFLIYLAYDELKKDRISLTSDKDSKTAAVEAHKLPAIVFLMNMGNPMTILTFIGVFSSITIKDLNIGKSIATIIGIFCGSMTWWLVLGTIVMKLKTKMSTVWLDRIKYITVIILGGFGVYAIISAVIKLMH